MSTTNEEEQIEKEHEDNKENTILMKIMNLNI